MYGRRAPDVSGAATTDDRSVTDAATAEVTTLAESTTPAQAPTTDPAATPATVGPRVVIGVGGTAGHVVPAIAVADVLRDHGARVVFAGGERFGAEEFDVRVDAERLFSTGRHDFFGFDGERFDAFRRRLPRRA